jgi:hypothetical protein
VDNNRRECERYVGGEKVLGIVYQAIIGG